MKKSNWVALRASFRPAGVPLLALVGWLGGAPQVVAQNVGDWQTTPGLATGYWDNDNNNSAGGSGTWQTWGGSGWVTQTGKIPGSSYPSNNVTHVTLLPGTTLTNSAELSAIVADEITISNGASLQIAYNTFTLNHTGATPYDLDIFGGLGLAYSGVGSVSLNSGATIAIENGGAMTNFCGTSSDNFAGAGYNANAIIFRNGSLFVMTGAKAGYIPLATWQAGSTTIFAPNAAGHYVPKQFNGQTFYNFVWNWPLQTGGSSGLSGNTTINGNFIIANANGTNVEDIPDGTFTLTVGGSIAVTNALYYPAASTAGNCTVNVGGNFTVDSTAGIRVNKAADICSVVFDGTAPQSVNIYGTNLSAGNFDWTVAAGSTVNLNSPFYLNYNAAGGGYFTNNGTLNITANGVINGSATILLSSGSLYNVSAATGGYSLLNGQSLGGAGAVVGNATIAGGATVHPGGGQTLTFKNNLTFAATATNEFDLTSSSTSGNDQEILNGAGAVLTAGGAQIAINSAGSLANADYVLIKVTGASGSISGSFNTTPVWIGTTPANASAYSIITSGNQVLLHYATAPVSRPVITSLSLSGNNLVLSGTNGAATTYYLLSSTNLLLPLSQWTSVATNTLGASGNFSLTATNVVTPGAAQRFYLLETP